MAIILRMPEIAANTSHALLETWIVTEGESVSQGDVLAEIETEKAMVEFIAEADGILYRRLVTAGVDVAVGSPIAVLSSHNEEAIDLDALLGQDHQSEKELAPEESSPALGERSKNLEPDSVESQTQERIAERHFASPIARMKSRELSIDISDVPGTGPQGRVTLRDILKASANPQRESVTVNSSSPTSPTSIAEYTDIPHSPMRKAIARRLSESKSSIPHFYLSTQCRVDSLQELKRQANEIFDRHFTVTDFVVAAAAHAFVAVPQANVIWTEDSLRKFSQVDISIAIATESGLLVPVIRDVGARSLTAVSVTIADLSERSRTGKIRQSELEGGSLTITNLGMYGTQGFTAILNPPQSGILAIGAARKAPIVIDDRVVPGTVMDCTLSVDHRAIDGALAAEWLAAFTRVIENPLVTLI